MSIKIIADSTDEFPENLRSQAVEKDGKYELDGSGVINKNKELLKDNAKLAGRAEKAEAAAEAAKESASQAAKEWEGKTAVDPEIEKLGNAAKAANLKASDIPGLSAKVTELQSKIDSEGLSRTIDEVAAAYKLPNLFKTAAKKDGLKFEKAVQTVDGKDVDVWYQVAADGAKTELAKFMEADEFYKDIPQDVTDSTPNTRRFAPQQPDSKKPLTNKFDAIREEVKAQQKPNAAAGQPLAERFYNRTSGAD